MKKHLLGLVPIVALGVSACGTPASTTGTSTAGSSPVQPFTMTSSRYDVTAKVDGLEFYSYTNFDPNGDVIIRVTIHNHAQNYYDYSYTDFGLEDSNGNIINGSAQIEFEMNGALQSDAKLAPGGTATGYIGFSMPSNTKDMKLTWNPDELGQTIKSVSLDGLRKINISN